MPHWKVVVEGEPKALDDLLPLFVSPDLTLSCEDGSYCLKSSRYSSIKDPNDVRAEAERSLDILRTVSSARRGPVPNLAIAEVRGLLPDGRYAATLSVSRGMGFWATDGTPDPLDAALSDPERIRRLVVAHAQNHHVMLALRTWATRSHDWHHLYIILDLIEEDLGRKRALVAKGWVPTEALDLFKHTANNAGALGPDARHGKLRTCPPDKPMDISDAEELVKAILAKWLEEKIGEHQTSQTEGPQAEL